MSKNSQPANNEYGAKRGTFSSYLIGYLLSLELTLVAYLLVVRHIHSQYPMLSHHLLVSVIVGLGLTQLLVQLIFFLRLGRESKPRWNLLVFGFAILVVVILVLGSLWIMNNLSYHMSPSQQETNKYLQEQDRL